MCGILGTLRFDKGPVDPVKLMAMTNTMRHRGPDGKGFVVLDTHDQKGHFFENDVPGNYGVKRASIGLGHRRLSIIDLEHGQQPMTNEDGTVWCVFNGEIYNYEELRERLIGLGHSFKTDHSDTETIIHAYEEWGTNCLQYFRGMFAIGIVDLKNLQLFLARDRAGKKPLNYYVSPDKLIFASEIKAIVADESVLRKIDHTALADYFTYDYIPSPKTIYKNIYKLQAGHYLLVDLNNRESIGPEQAIQYWDLQFKPDFSLSEAQWCERLYEELTEAIRLRLISDVPLGAFLSGGIDSSAVVAIMSKIQPDPVKTFSIGFSESAYDETQYALMVAKKYKTDHHKEIVEMDAISMLPKLAWQYDEPFADSSAIPTYYVSKAAREHVSVALSGDGGDEHFAGYRRHEMLLRFHHLVDWLPLAMRKMIWSNLNFLIPEDKSYKKYLSYFSNDQDERFSKVVSSYGWKKYFRHDFSESLGCNYENSFLTDLWNANSSDYTTRMQYVDIKSYLTDDILVKVDKASMLNSLEVRNPFLDHKVMECAATIPSSLKLHRYDKKYILKKMMLPEFGRDFLYRKKMGFGVPLEHWFKGELRDFLNDSLLKPNSYVRNFIDIAELRKMLSSLSNENRGLSEEIWKILFLEEWAKAYM